MTINTINVVRRTATNALDNYLEAIRQGDSLFKEHRITTPLRMTHFLAQALHETGGFTILRENMNYSAQRLLKIFGAHHSAAVTADEAETLAHHPEDIAERVYGLGNPSKAHDLGNTQRGDGFLYRGNGMFQTTGRRNHQHMGTLCGVNFVGNPDLVTYPAHALKPAVGEWTENNLNTFADKNDIITITKRINGGLTGLDEREAWFNMVWPLLNADAEPWQTSVEDDNVERLQKALNDLGAVPKLVVDGRYGPATRQAVKNFQAAVGIVADGIASPVTEDAIKRGLDTIKGVKNSAQS
ncbi:MAG: peptidoglycan-binding protein [Deltaproteobacteria bacterium]|nr:peptidoglycan-binding protein [Deltaproteobacteria bacterium]